MPTYKIQLEREYLTILKWFALIAMVIFHFTDALSYSPPSETVEIIGRLAFPLFGFILGYNLAAASLKNDQDIEAKLMRLLFIFGCFAQPFYWFIQSAALPLNIMFTLAFGGFMVFRYNKVSSWIALLILGVLVDYAWAGVLYILMSFLISRQSLIGEVSLKYILGFVAILGTVAVFTQSFYPLLAMPVIGFGINRSIKIKIPRWKWLFYVIYPAHLAAIQGIIYFNLLR